MPPRRGIVKSGNAGNSSKSTKPGEDARADTKSNENSDAKPLFPPGSKYPLSLLHERCQKTGWEKPVVDTRQRPGGFSFVVTLSRINKKTSQKESVQMEPHPPKICPTALEARHWGATYAMYRFSNGLQLNRVLPPGPREYWIELSEEHKKAPEHQKWMYDPDPFAARKEVDERQARAAEKRAEVAAATSNDARDNRKGRDAFNEFSKALPVRMATSLRDMVEELVKQGLSMLPDSSDVLPLAISPQQVPDITAQLQRLGFKPRQAANAAEYLSKPSPISANLLEMFSPLEACIEYLVLHVPESDLPQRFLPSQEASNPFVTSVHSGNDDLKSRWIQERAVKIAGWPPHIVKECAIDARLIEDWDLLIAALGKRLLGDDPEELFDSVSADVFVINQEDVEALGGHFEEPGHCVLPLFSAPVVLHILVSSEGLYPNRQKAPVYLTSTSVPAYIRLHLLSCLLQALKNPDFTEADGFLMAAMQCIEEHWAQVEDQGPPDISVVLQHMLPTKSFPFLSQVPKKSASEQSKPTNKSQAKSSSRRNPRSDLEIREEFEKIRGSEKYIQILTVRHKLPAASAKEQFLSLLKNNQVVVVVGETGCGKTTQLPQFILDSMILDGQGSKASIVVTQPRRLSAIGVAARVASERVDDGSVGYAIRGERRVSEKTALLFCTTGVVLRRLSVGDKLQDVSHIIVDEVHERSVDGDLLLLELKELLKSHPHLKIILMSATINHETFVKYFNNAPLLTIPGFTHPVTDLYLEDVVTELQYRPAPASSGQKGNDKSQKVLYEHFKSLGLDDQTVQAIQRISSNSRIDYQLISTLVSHIISTSKQVGGILVFLPGVQEIRECINALRGAVPKDEAEILPLHANLTSAEQMRVFAKTSSWKIVATTNVAETSITIDDILYVIDSGKVKEVQYDPDNNISRLAETWVTQAAARQRRGRAGRTQPGTCYKLYTRKQEQDMIKHPVPEILRVPLENVSLSVKAMREEVDVKAYLSQAVNPPKIAAMDRAQSILEELGALDENKLTALGRHLAMLPIDLRLGKMLVLGTIFKCLEPVLTIAACLSSKPLFLNPTEKRDEAKQAKNRFVKGNSDLLTDLNAYTECMRLSKEQKSQSSIKHFCDENFISLTTVREISMLRREYLDTLISMGFVPFDSEPSSPSLNTNSSNLNLIKSIVLGGLWPRVARVQLPDKKVKFDKVQGGTVQRENVAKDYAFHDLQGKRVFLHPSSVLFEHSAWKSFLLVYFQKAETSKTFLRDATEIPIWSVLLFGGRLVPHHVQKGLVVKARDGDLKLQADARIGALANQLRRILDGQLQRCIEDGTTLEVEDNGVVTAMLALLTFDGLAE
ncbi:P-loop containing nucleoside triphosphate hydrolase protein [Dendrothele bispora CBS 962.96]|uniref:RNA helicase n=1 Tax=Dendrothele bispora (strain CBS 962.96) TaxID=1314807 RepID=A0A4S8MFJ8_DENBC|nr:P-loop containing nucleoside triphosphate hydrolase protein [Dendrothele bispora CBS 962.96]